MQGKYQRNLRKDERIEKSALLGTYAWTVTKVPIIRGEKDSEVKSWHHIVAEWLSIELKNTKKGSLFSWARDSLFGTYSRVIIDFDEIISNAPVYSFQIFYRFLSSKQSISKTVLYRNESQ